MSTQKSFWAVIKSERYGYEAAYLKSFKSIDGVVYTEYTDDASQAKKFATKEAAWKMYKRLRSGLDAGAWNPYGFVFVSLF